MDRRGGKQIRRMGKSKMIKVLFIFIFLIIPTQLKSADGVITLSPEYELLPVINLSIDLNLYLTIGGGFILSGRNKSLFSEFNYSIFNKGNNISFGVFITRDYMISRYGFNRMLIKDENKKNIYWGIKTQQAILFVMLRGGIMYDTKNSKKIPLKLNLAGGLAVW